MKTAAPWTILSCVANLACATAAERQDVLETLRQRLEEQLSRAAHAESLTQTREYPDESYPSFDTWRVHLVDGIGIVSETRFEYGALTQQDYHLHESRVYAYRIVTHTPCLDEVTKRVAETWYFFDDDIPVFRSGSVVRIPISDAAPGTGGAEEEYPLPPHLDNLAGELTSRAFEIARTFQFGVGRFVFSDWDAWLLKEAPPRPAAAPRRTADWRPGPETAAIPVAGSESPDGIYMIAWGYEKSPVDWDRLAFEEEDGADWGEVSFSSKLAELPEGDPLLEDTNFLWHRLSGRTAGNLGLIHPGERPRFNHDALEVYWSPNSQCFVVEETWRWGTAVARIGWIENGTCSGTYDVMEPLREVATEALLKSDHPAASRYREDSESFLLGLSGLLVEDDGGFEARIVGQVPKDQEPGGLFFILVEGTFAPGEESGPASLEVGTSTVLPPEPPAE